MEELQQCLERLPEQTFWPALETGEIGRLLDAEPLASYAGIVPRMHASVDHTPHWRTRPL